MLSTREDEILSFIQEFENSAKDYLKSKGISDREMAEAYLQMQWEFLHTILQHHPPASVRKHHQGFSYPFEPRPYPLASAAIN